VIALFGFSFRALSHHDIDLAARYFFMHIIEGYIQSLGSLTRLRNFSFRT
jgi:hypothetical protein